MSEIKYYIKETTNTILVSGSSTKDDMNALLTSSKLPTPNFDNNLAAKISSLGMNSTYVVQNGTDTTSIPIADNQELWVYRGYNQTGGDGNTYRYNPHLHRPFKAYVLTETGSGVPGFPWSPSGSLLNTGADNGSIGATVPNAFDVKQLEILGNTNSAMSSSAVSGSFIIYDDSRGIHPFIFTKYHTLSSPPAFGAQFALYKENATLNFWKNTDGTNNLVKFNTLTNPTPGGAPAIGKDKICFNSSNLASVTEVYLDYTTYYTLGNVSVWNSELTQLSQSYNQGKTGGQLRIYSGSDPSQYVTFDINEVQTPQSSPPNFWTISVSNQSNNLGALFSNNDPITASFIGIPDLQSNLSQLQYVGNPQPQKFTTLFLDAGTYSYTSSVFGEAGFNGSVASGSTQFGLYADNDAYATFTINNQSTNGQDVRVFFTGSNGSFDSRYFDIQSGYVANFISLVGKVSASGITATDIITQSTGEIASSTCNITITNRNATQGTDPSDVFATRVNDVYISYSSSLSSSLDGLYVFNQIPQNDVQITTSMFLTAWTGSDTGSKYGDSDYGTNEYGEGEAGDGRTWPTASLRIYTGSYPTSPFGNGDYVTESIFTDENIHVNGLAITMSYLIPSQSISIKDCLQIALAVTSSQPLSEITSSLVVQEYNLELFTPTQSITGDGRVPTFVENAFEGTLGLSNTDDCQPLYANVIGERINNNIQIINEQPIESGYYSSSLQPIELPATGNVEYGGYVPTNFYAILSGSAEKSTVPKSYYTQLSQINPRYLGSETSANEVNSIEGLYGGYGTLPVIDYLTGYFAYCDQILDPYPVVNNKVQLNLKYLINAAGDALAPILSPYTAFDVEASWTAGGLGRIGVNQVSGSSQYDSINGINSIYEVAKEPVPILWSQTSSAGYASFIPLAGNPNEVSNFEAEFLQYGMTADGKSYSSANTDDKIVTMTNLLAGVSQSGYYSFNTGSRYGDAGSYGSNEASSSIITQYTPVTNPAYNSGDASKQGYVYFNRDIVQGEGQLNTTALSDVWKLRLNAEFPSTPPVEYRTDAGGFWDSSDYNKNEIGHIYLKLQRSTNASSWTDMTMTLLAEPVLRFYYSGGAVVDLNLRNVLGQNNAGLRNGNKQLYIRIHANDIYNALVSQGREPKNALYASFIFEVESNQTLYAENYYRWYAYQYYKNESVDPDRNYWNPTVRPQNSGAGVTPSRAYNGPYVTLAVQGTRESSNNQDNALNEPYWIHSGSNHLDYIWLSSSNGNSAYGNGYFQGYLPYSASTNQRFPGGIEPIDTEIPSYNINWNLNIGDEIRFENNESQTYTIIDVIPPQENSTTAADDGTLKLRLDREVPESVEKDFFLIRRYRYSPNTIVVNNLFPYGSLKTIQTAVDNTLTSGVDNYFDGSGNPVDLTGSFAVSSSLTTSGSVSYVSTVQPLSKQDNTPSGFFFPEFPTADIEVNTDAVIKDLRDKKLIE